jgi:hypothetical protein
MHIKHSLKHVVLGALALCGFGAVHAAVVTFTGGGTFTYHNGSVQNVPFTATFSYDTDATPVFSSASQGQYVGISFSLTVNLVEGTWTHTVASPFVFVNNGQYGDGFQVSSPGNSLNPPAPDFIYGLVPNSLNVELTGGNTVFSSTLLPEELDLADWTGTKVAKIYSNNYGFSSTMPFSTLTAAAVPEPATVASVIGGLVFVAAVYARRRRSAR